MPSARSWATFRCTAGFCHVERVHRRRHQHRAVKREQHRAQQVVGQAAGGLGEDVGRGGGNAQQFRPRGQLDVRMRTRGRKRAYIRDGPTTP